DGCGQGPAAAAGGGARAAFRLCDRSRAADAGGTAGDAGAGAVRRGAGGGGRAVLRAAAGRAADAAAGAAGGAWGLRGCKDRSARHLPRRLPAPQRTLQRGARADRQAAAQGAALHHAQLEHDPEGSRMITVLGSVNLDLIGAVSRIPKPGETVPGGDFSTAAGGKGANQALAARRAGATVVMVGAAGNDGFADEALALLRAGGVDLTQLRVVEGPTGIAMIFVDGEGENVIAVLPGANGTVGAAEAAAALAGLDGGDVLLLQQEIPQVATAKALQLARAQGVTSILNTAPFLEDTPALARAASIVVANETEFALLCGGEAAPLEAAMTQWARDNSQTVIVTLGPAGAWATRGEELLKV